MEQERLSKIEIEILKEQFENSPIFYYLFTTSDHIKGKWDDVGMWKYDNTIIAQYFIAYCAGAIDGALMLLSTPDEYSSFNDDDNDDDIMKHSRMVRQMEEEDNNQITIDVQKYLS